MYTTVDETGRLNNYAVEPATYLSSYPSPEQQKGYLLQGGLATMLVATLVTMAYLVS
ncbi:photosystem II assembly protein Psb34 [cf. Phormidesmis sp. LEGE 11477]|uniref:photosystem II assembly protein Psb34 n=1 Tax=cf. Phormidesmis sp. LEGE 11477 TaxID=1828680 RepID=UPI001881426A|nr:ssl1498 family light-harvesting-like protein [cf. Phormidesmis sp. LEGE 11477]MBE9061897.1 ssl1498 family light-harvesting-like protein [cf. Phormidesmis sp. LEGE 11477]